MSVFLACIGWAGFFYEWLLRTSVNKNKNQNSHTNLFSPWNQKYTDGPSFLHAKEAYITIFIRALYLRNRW